MLSIPWALKRVKGFPRSGGASLNGTVVQWKVSDLSSFRWTPRLILQVDSMDEEHRHLVSLMQKLAEQNEIPETKAKLVETFSELVKYTRQHFADEEALMQEKGFPEFARHKAAHEEILKRLHSDFSHFSSGSSLYLTEGFFSFLLFWLKNHIQKVDRLYADHIQGRLK